MIETLAYMGMGGFLFAAGALGHAWMSSPKFLRGREPRGQIIHTVVDADGMSVPQQHGDFVQANSIAEFLKEKEGVELSIGDVIKDDEM